MFYILSRLVHQERKSWQERKLTTIYLDLLAAILNQKCFHDCPFLIFLIFNSLHFQIRKATNAKSLWARLLQSARASYAFFVEFTRTLGKKNRLAGKSLWTQTLLLRVLLYLVPFIWLSWPKIRSPFNTPKMNCFAFFSQLLQANEKKKRIMEKSRRKGRRTCEQMNLALSFSAGEKKITGVVILLLQLLVNVLFLLFFLSFCLAVATLFLSFVFVSKCMIYELFSFFFSFRGKQQIINLLVASKASKCSCSCSRESEASFSYLTGSGLPAKPGLP